NDTLEKKYRVRNGLVAIENSQVYINLANTPNPAVRGSMRGFIVEYLLKLPFISNAFETNRIEITPIAEPMKKMLTNSYSPSRSGDIQFILKPAYFEGSDKGT